MAITQFPAASSGGLQQYEQLFTSSGTWTKPSGVKTVEVTCIGGTRGNGSYYPTAASGYFKGILDVSSLSTVAVTVGAAGNASTVGGTSSFGTLVSTPDSYAGGYYFPTKSGYSFPLESTSSIGTSDNWLGFASGTNYFATANDGQLAVLRGSGNGFVANSANGGASWSLNSFNGGPDYSSKILKNSSGNYFAINLYDPNNNPYISGSYSTNGTTWNAPTGLGGGYNYGLGLGPVGFLIATNNGWFKSTDGATWTSVTVTGSLSGQGNQFRVHGTSTRYYAIPTTASGSTIYTSTDGVAWTSFSAAFSYGSYQSERYWCAYNDKLYYKPDNAAWLGVIDGTSSSSVTSVNSGYTFVSANVPFFRDSSALIFYHVDSPTATVLTVTYGGAGSFNGMLSNGSYFKRESAGYVTSIIKATLYAGSIGISAWTPGSTGQGSPGVRGPGVQANTTYGYPAGGPGNEDGWGCGAAGGSGLINLNSKSYGSGVSVSNGNQGAVRVRWWA